MPNTLTTAQAFLHARRMVPTGPPLQCAIRAALHGEKFSEWYKAATNKDVVLVVLHFDKGTCAAIISGGLAQGTTLDSAAHVFHETCEETGTTPVAGQLALVTMRKNGLPSFGADNELLWYKTNSDIATLFRWTVQTNFVRVYAPESAEEFPQWEDDATKLAVCVMAQRYSAAPLEADLERSRMVPADYKVHVQDLLRQHLPVELRKRLVINLVGAPSSGKSTLGNHLASLMERQTSTVFQTGQDQGAGQHTRQINERIIELPDDSIVVLRDLVAYENGVDTFRRENPRDTPVPDDLLEPQKEIDELTWWPKPVSADMDRVNPQEIASVMVLVISAQSLFDVDPLQLPPPIADLRTLVDYLRQAPFARGFTAEVPVLCVVTQCDRVERDTLPLLRERTLLSRSNGHGARLRDKAALALGVGVESVRLLGWCAGDPPDYHGLVAGALTEDPRVAVLSSILSWAARSGAEGQRMRMDRADAGGR
jgi:energy-coupling factor transporter ATP-binding protein EcfA2